MPKDFRQEERSKFEELMSSEQKYSLVDLYKEIFGDGRKRIANYNWLRQYVWRQCKLGRCRLSDHLYEAVPGGTFQRRKRQPRPTGTWTYENGSWVCSHCGHAPNKEDRWSHEYGEPSFPFCPYCGAAMAPLPAKMKPGGAETYESLHK